MGHFLPFYHPNSPKNQNLEKMKKTPRDIIILHKCTKNHDHMLYCSWDIACDIFNCYFSFWATFCPFTQPKNSKFLKNEKNTWRYHYSTTYYYYTNMRTTYYDQMMYGSWDMAELELRVRDSWIMNQFLDVTT